MACQLENELRYVKNCLSVYEQNSLVNSFRVDDKTPESVIIASIANCI